MNVLAKKWSFRQGDVEFSVQVNRLPNIVT